ncbi:DUF3089 domain-containing protein [Caulobacter sp. RL271]|jgi:hypothetical protein|uniref:DUF3089 domain-containing protein n=1 Tax=Caulobacter segnis TaxID=88688 RepID=A0ABY4ZVM8_9CAUL|nr:DUF3089 domain-containing protein [Caulobacter segnis]USQ96626.1 DUF3089 domain-containing protein [Caulobacter segnis]
MAQLLATLGLTIGLALANAACAQAPAASVEPNDYGKTETWLCLPGRKDACVVDQTTTIVQADGKTSVETFKAAAAPNYDCFYVYPTVSTDPGGNSDMVIDEAERRVVEQQLARFASQCRVFAPMYRQVTLAALRAVMMGQPSPGNGVLAYGDVRDAWRWYLANENKGRGVVLIGHSQGSRMLLDLLKNEVDGKLAQANLISAYILGMTTPVDAAGKFGSIPLCVKADQAGCLVTYVSFRETSPPPANSRFGKTDAEGRRAGCVNPAALLAGKASTEDAPVHAYLSSKAFLSSGEPKPFAKGLTVSTPFVSLPGLVSARCVADGDFTYLSVKVNADPADPRTDEISGDIVVAGNVLKDWGLHLIDVNLEMGDLVALVDRQAKAYAGR